MWIFAFLCVDKKRCASTLWNCTCTVHAKDILHEPSTLCCHFMGLVGLFVGITHQYVSKQFSYDSWCVSYVLAHLLDVSIREHDWICACGVLKSAIVHFHPIILKKMVKKQQSLFGELPDYFHFKRTVDMAFVIAYHKSVHWNCIGHLAFSRLKAMF